MNLKSRPLGFLNCCLLGAAIALPATAVLAQLPFAQTTDGANVLTSAGECWQSVGGALGYCGEAPAPVPPPPDADRDGVADAQDRCPQTRLGVRVVSLGCALDLDGDGVVYYLDHCQTTPPGARIDPRGCMDKIVLSDVGFRFDRADLTGLAKSLLDDLATALDGRTDIQRVRIGGHADSTGSRAYNQALSESRAQSVADYLRAKGITQALSVAGYGETRPAASNAEGDGRALNRRVEIEFDIATP